MNRRVLWLLLLLLLCNVLAYVDRTNLSFAIASPDFRSVFSLTDKDRGILNSAFFWMYAVLQIPAGAVADRFGVRWPLAAGVLLWSLVSAGTGQSNTFAQLIICRLLLAVGEAILTPAGLKWVRVNIDEKQRGFAMGIFFSGAKAGPVVASALAVWLLQRHGWRMMFLVLGLGSLVWIVPWLLLSSDDRFPRKAAQTQGGSFASVLSTPAIYGIVIATFAYNYFNFYCMTWLPAYFVDHLKLSLAQSGGATAVGFTGFAIVAILAGVAADRIIASGGETVKVRRVFAITGMTMASISLLGAISTVPGIAITSAVVSLFSLGLTTANYWALTQTLMPAGVAGKVGGVQNFASTTSGGVASLVTGFLLQWTGTYRAPLIACSAVLATGAVCYFFLVQRKHAPQLSETE